MNRLTVGSKIKFESNRFDGRVFGVSDALGNEYLIVVPNGFDRKDLKFIRVNLKELDPAHIHDCSVVIESGAVDALISACADLLDDHVNGATGDVRQDHVKNAQRALEHFKGD